LSLRNYLYEIGENQAGGWEAGRKEAIDENWFWHDDQLKQEDPFPVVGVPSF